MAGAISAAMFAADRWTATWPRLAHHLSIPGAMLVAILLVAGLEATFRPAVELTLQGDKVEYYFHNAEFCTAFKLRNLAAMNR